MWNKCILNHNRVNLKRMFVRDFTGFENTNMFCVAGSSRRLTWRPGRCWTGLTLTPCWSGVETTWCWPTGRRAAPSDPTGTGPPSPSDTSKSAAMATWVQRIDFEVKVSRLQSRPHCQFSSQGICIQQGLKVHILPTFFIYLVRKTDNRHRSVILRAGLTTSTGSHIRF